MEPSVGRIVHFHRELNEGEQPNAAIIIKVYSASVVDLVVFSPELGMQQVVEARFKDDSMTTGDAYWAWPPRV